MRAKRLGQQGLAGSRGADQHDVRLRQFDAVAALAVHVDPLVMVVNGDRELLFGLILADDIFIKKGFYFLRLGELVRGGA